MARGLAIVILVAWAAQGCAALQARQEYERLVLHVRENSEAWRTARQKLQAMCAAREVPCAQRAIKLTASPRLDDWVWMDLPLYQIVHRVHEDELRQRHEPLAYEEYMIGVSRYLAERADRGELPPVEFANAFNAAWAEMGRQLQGDADFRRNAVQDARKADAESWQRFQLIGVALGGALVGAAGAGAFQGPGPSAITTPVVCQAVPMGYNTVTGQSYGTMVRCR